MTFHYRNASFTLTLIATTALVINLTGCGKPKSMDWGYTGPRVYLIEGTDNEQSNGLCKIRNELDKQEINAKVVEYDDWLKIVNDIDADPDEEVILVGHGHGAFLATQVARHFAQEHKTKHIDAVFLIDAYNKDWPHNLHECGCWDPHERPMQIPAGHNALKVRNYNQTSSKSDKWGSDIVTTRGSNLANQHPYYWYDDYWNRRAVSGQKWGVRVDDDGICHETIDNRDELIKRIVSMCRKAALSPFHYTPPEHYPNEQTKPTPARSQGSLQRVW